MKRFVSIFIAAFILTMGWAQQNAHRKVVYTTLQTTITSVENWLAKQDLSQYPPSAVLELHDALQIAKDVVAAQNCMTGFARWSVMRSGAEFVLIIFWLTVGSLARS